MNIREVREQFPQYNDLTDVQLADAIRAKYYPDLPKETVYAKIGLTQPEGGFIAATKAGATELGGGISALMGKLGLKDTAQAQREYEEAQKRAKEIFKPTEAGWTEDPWTKFKETLGGSVPYMAAPLAAGAAAAALPLTGTAATIAGLGAAGLTSAGQFTATNLARQMDEGKKLEETSGTSAFLAALPQAALDTLSMRMIPGIGKMFGAVGEKVTAQTAKQIAEQGLKKVAADYAMSTGKAMGTEGLTEAAQQVFERLQAGLNITDEQARQEYFDNFIGGAVLGGALAPAGRYVERGGEKAQAQKLLAEEQKVQRAKDAAAEEEKRQQPDYLEGLNSTYQDLQQQKQALQAQLKKSTKDTPLTQDDKDNNELINRQLKELSKPLEQARREFLDAGGMPALQKMRAAQPPRIELTSEGQETLGGPEPEPEPTAEEAAARDVPRMQAFLESQRAQMAQAGSPEEALQIAQQMQKLSQQIEAAQKLVPETPATPAAPDAEALAKREKRVLKALSTAQEQGDFDKVVTYGQQLQELREQQKSAAQATQAAKDAEGLFAPEQIAAEDLRRTAYEMGTERERRAQERETQAYEQRGLDLEQEFNREKDARDAEMAGYERAVAEDLQKFRGAPQTSLFPEKRERKAVQRESVLPGMPYEMRSTAVPAEGTQVDIGPKATDAAQVATLLTRLQDSNNVDTATKDLAAATEQLPQVTQARLRPLVRDWAYRALSGTPSPELEQELREHLRTAQQGAISETEQRTQYAQRALTEDEKASLAGTSMEGREGMMTRAPSGEIAQQMQYTLPMPEPTAEARESWGAFNEYLASDGLDILRKSVGLTAPTVARLQEVLAPVQSRINALQAQVKDISAKRSELQSADFERRTQAANDVRVAEEKLQNTLAELNDFASVTFVGKGRTERSVNLTDMLNQAKGRVSEALTHSDTLRQQIAENLQNLTKAKTDTEDAGRLKRGQLPATAAVDKVRENLRTQGMAFVAADEALAKAVVKGVNAKWGEGAPGEATYKALKRARDMALRKAQHAEYMYVQALKRVPSAEQLNANFSKTIAEKEALDMQLTQAVRVLSGLQLGITNTTKRLDAAKAAVKENPLFNFGPALESLQAQLQTAQQKNVEAQRQSAETQGTLAALAETSRGLVGELQPLRGQVDAEMRSAQQRAEARRTAKPTTTEALAEREARDAAQRREEQARLERAEQGRTRVEFRRQTLAEDPNIANLQDEAETADTPELREAARKKLTEILNQRAAKLDEEAKAMAQRAAKNVKDLNAARTKLAELEDTIKKHESGEKKLTPKRLESAKKQRDEAARKFEEHQRRYQLNTNEVRIVRTDIQQERADRKQLLEEVNRTRVAGERLGVSEGTQKRGISPTMRDEVFPPRTLRTGSEESRAGETTTTNKNPLTEVRGVKQRDVAMTEEEQIEANKIAEDLRKKKEAEAAERALEATKTAAALGKEKAPRAPKSRVARAVAAETEEETLTPAARQKVEAAATTTTEGGVKITRYPYAGPDVSRVRFSRGAVANPSTSASVKEELKATFGGLSRIKMFDTVDDLLAAHPEYEGKIPADSRGFVDTAGNKAFLIGENIEQGQALGVLLHEVGAHIGLKNMLGEAQYNALVKAVEKWAAQNNGSTESRVARAAQQRVEAAETTDAHKDDELLAYAIEEAVAAGVTPTAMKGPIGQWLGRIVQSLRKALEKFGLKPKDVSLQDIVNMAYGAAQKEMTTAPTLATEKAAIAAAPEVGDLFFSKKSSWNPGMQAAGAVVDKAVATEQSWASKLKASLYGFRTMTVDKLAPVEQALQQKVAEGTLPNYKATQTMYFLRMYDMRNHFTSKAVSDGVPHLAQITRDDGRKERIIEAKPGANLKGIVDILKSKDVAKAAGSADAAHRLFSMYLIAKRAERVGLDKLDFGGSITEADLKTVKQAVESDPTLKKAFKEARDQYNQYNRNLLEFSVQTGAMSRELADNLLSSDDYTPYYRVKDGVVNMLVGGQHPIKIGNLKDSPHLQELIGGDKPVIDFLTASVQNTSMLLDMAMKNIAQKNLVWEMHDLGLAKMRTAKHGAAPQNAIKFYDKGVESYALLDEAALADMGLDAGLMLKGLQGIPTMLPAALRLMAIPARILRRAVVASPVYAARQLFRDSLGAAMTSGANLTPVVSALRQFGKTTHTLDKRGVTGGQVFSGMPDDISRLLKQMQAGKGGWTMALAKLEAMSMEADAATRRAQYESYRKQGLSEMEATYMALESMNFSKRGLSPSLHAISQIIPFFNAQIQSLDVLQRAMRGKMPMQEQLDIKRKLYTRGLLLAAGTLAYAMAMQDDDAYKNATPEQKYGNWFVRVPGLDEPVRVPIPFELGYIFKALPEAMVNTMLNEKGGEDALKALAHIVQQTIPGGSSYGIPQAVKPLIEVGLGKSFFTGRDIESAKEQMEEPFMRYRDKTTDAAKWVGEVFNISPVKIEYLINGYTGGMGLAMMAALNPVFPDVTAPGALKRLSEYPVVGGAFQPNDAAGIIDGAYERVLEIQRVQQTYKTLLQQNPQRAQAYLEEKGSELAMASAAGQFRQTMGELTKQERAIRSAPSMTPQAKRDSLDRIRQVKIRLAASMRPALDRTTPPAARP